MRTYNLMSFGLYVHDLRLGPRNTIISVRFAKTAKGATKFRGTEDEHRLSMCSVEMQKAERALEKRFGWLDGRKWVRLAK